MTERPHGNQVDGNPGEHEQLASQDQLASQSELAGQLDALVKPLYRRLSALAEAYLRRERRDHTLTPGALVHEAYLQLSRHPREWRSRAHFFAAAAQVMRRLLVDHAKHRGRKKRLGGRRRIPLDAERLTVEEADCDVLAVHEAISKLEERDADQARLVEMRFFAGLTLPECAAMLGRSSATVERQWRAARDWLQGELEGGE